MAQTFIRVNKTRKEAEVADLRRDIISKQCKNLDKYRKSVYDLIEDNDSDFYDEYDEYDQQED